MNESVFQYDADRKLMNTSLTINSIAVWFSPCQTSASQTKSQPINNKVTGNKSNKSVAVKSTITKLNFFIYLANQNSISLLMNFRAEEPRSIKQSVALIAPVYSVAELREI